MLFNINIGASWLQLILQRCAFLIPFLTVHFDVPVDHKLDQEAAADAILERSDEKNNKEKSMDDSMMEVVEAQKRVLDQWCFAEHYEPHVLLQVSLPLLSCFTLTRRGNWLNVSRVKILNI